MADIAGWRRAFVGTTMMGALLAKEIRALRPLRFAIAGLLALILLYGFATDFPDEQRLDPVKWLASDRSGAFVVIVLFGLMIGASLFVHESAQGTLRFLDGLPVSRTRVFAAKSIAAFASIALVPILGLSCDVALGWLSRTSIDPPFPWRFVCTELGLQLVAGAFVVALAMTVSFLRSWVALIVGLIFWAYLWLRARGVDWLAWLDPNELLAVELTGGEVRLPWHHLEAQLSATAVFLGIAWLAFGSLGDRVQFAGERLVRWHVLRMLGSSVRLLAPVVWVAAIIRLAGDSPRGESNDSTAPLGEKAFARRETARYEFLFRAAQEAQARPLLERADGIHDAVTTFLGAAPPLARIVVDLASPVVPHAAGQTNWSKIRLPLAPGQALAEQRRILGHETTHVFIEQLSDGRLSGQFRYVRFLHEGLATLVEQDLFSDSVQRARNRRWVAAAWARGKVPFELLSDDDTLRRSRDANLAYPLGEVFARALIDTHGRQAPLRLLHAFGRKKAPVGLADGALWRDTMQAAGLDLDRVVAAYDNACAEIARDEQSFVGRLPRLAATVTVEGPEIVIRPHFEGTAPGDLICFIEVDEVLNVQTRALPRRNDGSFTWPRRRLLKSTLRYELGWQTPDLQFPVFEPWAEASL